MKKKVIAIAVVAALLPAAAMAEVTVYGRIHASVDSVSGIAAQQDNVTVNSNSSRFGVKGSQELDGGLKALYQVEAGVNANGTSGNVIAGARDTYIGLTGGFGTFLTGRLPAANQYVYDSNLFADQMGDAANFTAGKSNMPGRANSALHYVAPALGDVTVAVTYLPASSVKSTLSGVTADQAQNSYGITAGYAAHGVTAKVAYFDVGVGKYAALGTTDAHLKPLSVAGSYDFGGGMLSAQYVSNNLSNAGTTTTQNIFNIGAKFNLSAAAALKAQFSNAAASSTAGAKDGATMVAVGADYSLGKNTGVYVVYAVANNDTGGTFTMNNWGHQDQTSGLVAGEKPSGVGVGLTHNF